MADKVPSTSTKVRTQSIACDDPRAVPASLNFDGVDNWQVSLQQMQENNQFSGLQAIYFDASDLTDRVLVTVQNPNQTLQITEATQGYLPLICGDPPVISFDNDGGGNIGILRLVFLNVPVPAAVWAAAP